MTEPQFEDRPTEGAFPEAADDDYPERARYPETQAPDLPTEDGYQGAGAVGTTSREERDGESLDTKLSHERPERAEDPLAERDPDERLDWDDEVDGGKVGQLTSPDQGAGPDLEKDEIANEDPGEPGGGVSPEESALHVQHEQ